MRTHTIALLSGIAALALAGSVALGASKHSDTHEMTIRLADGTVEHIQYTGNVAPRIVIGSDPFTEVWPGAAAFWSVPSFSALDRISAEMDRSMEELMRRTEALVRAPLPDAGAINQAALRDLPSGSSYSMTAMSNGKGVCTRTVQVTASANGGKPQVVSHSYGSCDASSGVTPTLAPNREPGMTPVKLPTPAPNWTDKTSL